MSYRSDEELLDYSDSEYAVAPLCDTEGYGIMGPFKLTPSHLVLTREESEFN
ncbi:hypothetical protein V1524DRAFT_412293, partial [Lipomyces starkeyi]